MEHHASHLRRLRAWAFERLYHELAPVYEAVAWGVSAGGWDGWRRRAVPHLAGRVLEIGVGTGALFLALLDAGLDAYGIDLSPAMAALATRKLRRRGVSPAQIARADARMLPFPDAAFDGACFTFPSNFALAGATAAEVRRVLRPGGVLVVVDGGPRWPARSAGGPPVLPYEKVFRDAGFGVETTWEIGRIMAVATLVATRDEAPA